MRRKLLRKAALPEDNRDATLMRSVHDLVRLTGWLERAGNLILLLTGGAIFAAVTVPMYLQSSSDFGIDPRQRATISIFLISIVFMNLAALILYERMHRRADTLFEEISDELNWYLRGNSSSDAGVVAIRTPPLNVRIALRAYTRTTDLPLIPGKFGPGVYGLVNLLLVLLTSLWGLV